MASIGYGYSRQDFLNVASDFAISSKKKSANDPPLTQSWYNGFKKRNPELTLAKPQKLSVVRAMCTSESVMNNHFDGLEKLMTT
jgi:hypothetical protein